MANLPNNGGGGYFHNRIPQAPVHFFTRDSNLPTMPDRPAMLTINLNPKDLCQFIMKETSRQISQNNNLIPGPYDLLISGEILMTDLGTYLHRNKINPNNAIQTIHIEYLSKQSKKNKKRKLVITGSKLDEWNPKVYIYILYYTLLYISF